MSEEKIVHQHYSCDWCERSFYSHPSYVDMGRDVFSVCPECFAQFQEELKERGSEFYTPDWSDPDKEEI